MQFWKGLFVTNQCRRINPNFRYCGSNTKQWTRAYKKLTVKKQILKLHEEKQNIVHGIHRRPPGITVKSTGTSRDVGLTVRRLHRCFQCNGPLDYFHRPRPLRAGGVPQHVVEDPDDMGVCLQPLPGRVRFLPHRGRRRLHGH